MEGEWPDGGDDTRTLGRHARANAPETHRDGQQTAPPSEVASVAPTVDAATVLRDHAPHVSRDYFPGAGGWRETLECVAREGEWRGDPTPGGGGAG